MLIAYFSDKARHRFSFVIFSICISITGFAILISVSNRHNLQYAALFLVTMGTYSAMPVIGMCTLIILFKFKSLLTFGSVLV